MRGEERWIIEKIEKEQAERDWVSRRRGTVTSSNWRVNEAGTPTVV